MTVSKRLILAFILGLAFTIIADLTLKATVQPRAELWGGSFLGYWGAFGLVWFLIIVACSKLLGRYWLERREGYYEGEEQVGDE